MAIRIEHQPSAGAVGMAAYARRWAGQLVDEAIDLAEKSATAAVE